ncbi:MAG: hypothetical protein KGZ39_01590 [Simkania sp.]|nr:hypothetical protein [Simkania sp.]
MKRPLIAAFLSCCASLVLMSSTTQSTSGMLSSSSAAYDGTALVLSGQVVLDHGLGKMRAEQATLEKQDGTGKEFPFSSIHLKNGVELDLPEQSRLRCAYATLDFTILQGKLTSSQNTTVSYIDVLKRKNGQAIPLHFSSQEADLFFNRLERPGQRSDFLIKTVHASGDVAVDYGSLFLLKAGKAIYQKSSQEGPLVQGTIQAFPTDAFSICRIEHQTDIVDAEAIDIDLAHTAIVLKKAQGVLTSAPLPRMQQAEVRFRCDQVLWDYPKSSLHLQGHVRIDESMLGRLATDGELTVVQSKAGVSSMRSIGNTQLEFQELEDSPMHKLICHGKMTINHEKMQAVFESTPVNGEIALDQQLYYEEGKIAVYADRGIIDYAAEGKKLHPSSISLKGHIRLRSYDASRPPRYGVADWINYSPTTRTFILGAHPGKKVLFLDEKENLRISAQEIHLTQEGNGDAETVKGVGNVQFAFTADEEVLLKSLFGVTN